MKRLASVAVYESSTQRASKVKVFESNQSGPNWDRSEDTSDDETDDKIHLQYVKKKVSRVKKLKIVTHRNTGPKVTAKTG